MDGRASAGQGAGRRVGAEVSATDGFTETDSWRGRQCRRTQRGQAWLVREQAETAGSGPVQHGAGAQGLGRVRGRGPRRPAEESHRRRSNSSIPFLSKKTDRCAFLSPKSLGPRLGALVPIHMCPSACPSLARSLGLCCTHSREAWQPRRAPVVGTGERYREGQADGDTGQLVTFLHSRVPLGSSWQGRSAAPGPTDTETFESSGEPEADRPSSRGAGDPGRAGPAVSVGQVWTGLWRSDSRPSATLSVLVAEPVTCCNPEGGYVHVGPGWGGSPAREGSRGALDVLRHAAAHQGSPWRDVASWPRPQRSEVGSQRSAPEAVPGSWCQRSP